MKSDAGDLISPGETAVVKGQARKTVSDVIEHLGLTGHTNCAIIVFWLVYFISGWSTTSVTFLLDAAAQEKGNWVAITSSKERLTIHDRSFTLLLAGVMSAVCNILVGNLSDVIGKIPVTQCSVFIVACVTIGVALAPGKLALMLLILILQVDMSTMAAQSLLAEWVPVTPRGLSLVLLTAVWNVGRLGMTLLWAGLPPVEHWKAFFLTVAVFPTALAIFLIARGRQYESPRWLAVAGDMERCVDTLRLAAQTAPADTKPLPDGWDDPANLQLESDSGNAVQVTPRSKWAQMGELCEPKLQRIAAIVGFCYFAVGFSWSAMFYWLLHYFHTLGIKSAGVPVMIVAPIGKLTAVAILLAPFVPGQCLVDRVPRTWLLRIGYFGAGLCVAALCMTTNVIVLTAIMFVMMIFEGFIWGVMHIYVPEAFPTSVRNGATGVTWFFGSLGGIVSAAVTGELMEIWVYLPMVTTAAFMFAGCAACFLLTEDRGGSPLIDTMGYGTCGRNSVSNPTGTRDSEPA